MHIILIQSTLMIINFLSFHSSGKSLLIDFHFDLIFSSVEKVNTAYETVMKSKIRILIWKMFFSWSSFLNEGQN